MTSTPDDARDQLASAGAAADRLRARGRWTGAYMTAFGLGFGALTLLVGLMRDSRALTAVIVVGWGLFVAAMVRWTRTRPATERGAVRRMQPLWMLTTVLYAIALAVGLPQDAGARFWWAAGAVVALPLLVGAARERQR